MKISAYYPNVQHIYSLSLLYNRDTKMPVLFAKVPAPEFSGKCTGVSST